MDHQYIINQLAKNKEVLKSQLISKSEEEIVYKPDPEKWCMLEVLCHLVDEEREDFRVRIEYVLRDPLEKLPAFDPTIWPETRKYMAQNFTEKIDELIDEREKSVEWLLSLVDPKWSNAYMHPKAGLMKAEYFLANWLAHDYIHIRQLNRLSFEFLQRESGVDLSYAGNF